MPINFKLSQGSSVMLDLIRGMSAQLVVLGHGISFFGIFSCLGAPHFPLIQNIAVLIFFLLSGFLITYSTIRKMDQPIGYSFKQYFIERFSRIYSALIPALLFVLLVDFISIRMASEKYMHHDAFNIKTFIGNLVMFQDFPFLKWTPVGTITSFGSARPLWTLAVEWWIYLFFGYFVLVILRKRLKLQHLFVLGLFAIVPFFNLIAGRGNGLFVYWLFGSMIYLMLITDLLESMSKRIKWVLIFAMLFCAATRIKITMEEYEPVFAFLLMIVIGLLIDLFKDIRFSSGLEKLIRINANFSYTLYLIHYSILDFVFTHFSKGNNPYVLFIVAFLASNMISFVIASYSEMRLTNKVKSWLNLRFSKG